MGRPEIKITTQMQNEAMRLASLGFSERQIAEAVGISISTWQRNKESFEHSLKKGRSELRERITSSLLAKTDEGDTTALIFTCKRLNLLSSTFDAEKPNNVNEAMAQLLRVYMAFSNGDITDATADKMTAMLHGYIKAYEMNELEARLKTIEERINK